VAHRHRNHPCVVVASSHCLIAYRAIVVNSWHPIAIALAWPPVALSTSIASHRGSSLVPLRPLHSTCRLLQLWQHQPFVGRQLIAATFRLLGRALWPPSSFSATIADLFSVTVAFALPPELSRAE